MRNNHQESIPVPDVAARLQVGHAGTTAGTAWDIAQLEALACDALDAAAAVTLPLFGCPLAVHDKGTGGVFDPVTPADRWAERAMRALLRQQVPEHRIAGEEVGLTGSSQAGSLLWVLDPIDGTKSYLAGLPSWGTLAGVWHGDEPLLGAADYPVLGERFIGSVHGARRVAGAAEVTLQVRRCARLSDAVLCATEPAAAGRIASQVQVTRYSTDGYGYMLLAGGLVDVVVDTGLSFHDVAAVVPIVHAAGGIITDWSGGSDFASGRIVAAGDPRIHAQALPLLASDEVPCAAARAV